MLPRFVHVFSFSVRDFPCQLSDAQNHVAYRDLPTNIYVCLFYIFLFALIFCFLPDAFAKSKLAPFLIRLMPRHRFGLTWSGETKRVGKKCQESRAWNVFSPNRFRSSIKIGSSNLFKRTNLKRQKSPREETCTIVMDGRMVKSSIWFIYQSRSLNATYFNSTWKMGTISNRSKNCLLLSRYAYKRENILWIQANTLPAFMEIFQQTFYYHKRTQH